MADLLKVTEEFVYLRVKMPRHLYEQLEQNRGSSGRALQVLRLRWQAVIESVSDEHSPH